ncbi:MAG: DUF4129 domain-containing protein [Nocardioidaceae bacterium]|nr:DUF4129 domain-containing protein [Nocardioidaceae bacterium]
MRPNPIPPLMVVLAASGLTVICLAADSVTLTNKQLAIGIAAVGLVVGSVDACMRRHSGIPWRTLLLRALIIGVLVLPVFAGFRTAELPLPEPAALQPPDVGSGSEVEGSFAQRLDRILGVLLALAVLALLVRSGLLIALLRRTRLVLTRRHRQGPAGLTAAGAPVGEQAQERARDEALRRSARALGNTDDARLAVIAAYVALEEHLVSARFPRERSETAREFVTRALVQDRPADRERVETLLQVFEAARFSLRPITSADAQVAHELLEALVRT